MTTSQPTSFLSEIVSGAPIPPEKLGYFRGRFSNKLHELILELFDELERAGKITRASLARRIGKAPEQITRWLGAPGNLTVETVSDLFLGMGYEPAVSAEALTAQEEETVLTWADLPQDDPSYIMLKIPHAAAKSGLQSSLSGYGVNYPFDTEAFGNPWLQTNFNTSQARGLSQKISDIASQCASLFDAQASSNLALGYYLVSVDDLIEIDNNAEKFWRLETIGAQQAHKRQYLLEGASQ